MSQSPLPNPLSQASNECLRLEEACLDLGARRVLGPLSLSLPEHRIAILGRNGSGKTSFLRLIAGLVAPSSGQVHLGPYQPAQDRKAMLSRIGILFQNPEHQIIFPVVREELAFGLTQMGHSRKEADQRVIAALAQHQRSHWLDLPVASLSQGQKQFLCLLAIFLMQPACILLDEPFAALDLPAKLRLKRQIAALPQQVITITHDPAELGPQDRAIWIEAGKIVDDGPAEAVYQRFRAEMTRLGEQDADADITP